MSNHIPTGRLGNFGWVILSYLSPQQGTKAQHGAPEPLVDGEAHTAERLPSKLNDDDLKEKEKQKSMRMG